MNNFSLKTVDAKDSRGRPTVAVELTIDGDTVRGDVPAGASKGEDEARTVPVDEARAEIEGPIAEYLKTQSLEDAAGCERADRGIVALAGERFSKLGANSVVPVSRALWNMGARRSGVPLHQLLRQACPGVSKASQPVRFLMNIFNGGLHALRDGESLGTDRIDFQEVMVVPMRCDSYREALDVGDRVDQALKALLIAEYGEAALHRADEAGFSVKGLGNSDKAIDLVLQSVGDAGLTPGEDVKISLDVAASSFFDPDTQKYRFQNESIDSQAMVAVLCDMVARRPGIFWTIEDGLAENDWEAWTSLTRELAAHDVVTVGDDLFVTQEPRLSHGIETSAAGSILIKVNQNGSIIGTLDVIRQAASAGIQSIVSHRSGETLDDSIADLAFAVGAMGLKTGDPQPPVDFPDKSTWVRRAKYLRMIALEESSD